MPFLRNGCAVLPEYTDLGEIKKRLDDYNMKYKAIQETGEDEISYHDAIKMINEDSNIYLGLLSNHYDLYRKNCLKSSDFIRNKEVKFGMLNGKEINWIVLERKDDLVLLCSKNCLFKYCYHEDANNIYLEWKDCSLRQYLNGDFYNGFFSDYEKKLIKNTTNDNSMFFRYYRSETKQIYSSDNIFCLSFKEAIDYFREDSSRIAKDEGTNTASLWWLRNRLYDRIGDISHALAVCVSRNGSICNNENGYLNCEQNVSQSGIGVRPAMWIDLKKL